MRSQIEGLAESTVMTSIQLPSSIVLVILFNNSWKIVEVE